MKSVLDLKRFRRKDPMQRRGCGKKKNAAVMCAILSGKYRKVGSCSGKCFCGDAAVSRI